MKCSVNTPKLSRRSGPERSTFAETQSNIADLQKLLARQPDALATLQQRMTEQGELLAAYGNGFNSVSASVEAGHLASTADANAALGKYKDNVHRMESTLAALAQSAQTAVDSLHGQIDETSGSAKTAVLSILVDYGRGWWRGSRKSSTSSAPNG